MEFILLEPYSSSILEFLLLQAQQSIHYTVDENTIGLIPCILVKFLHCSPLSSRSANFAIAKVVALDFFSSFYVGMGFIV